MAESEIDAEIDFLEEYMDYDGGYQGRLSPYVKEKLYREYMKGMPVKDLSLKYGIMHMRVKAIIF